MTDDLSSNPCQLADELRAGIALQLREMERLRLEAKHAELADKENERALRETNDWWHSEKADHEQTKRELASLREKYAAAQHAADCLEAKCNALHEAAASALYLLKKDAPGWGVAKDILALAIHNTGKQT